MQLQGVVYEGRKAGSSSPEKAMFARPAREARQLESVGTNLRKAVEQLQPTALIGAAAVRGAFSREVLSQLSQVSPDHECSGKRHLSAACGSREQFKDPCRTQNSTFCQCSSLFSLLVSGLGEALLIMPFAADACALPFSMALAGTTAR